MVISRGRETFAILENNPRNVGKLWKVLVKSGQLSEICSVRALWFDFPKALFLGEAPQLFGSRSVKGRLDDLFSGFFGQLQLDHDNKTNTKIE